MLFYDLIVNAAEHFEYANQSAELFAKNYNLIILFKKQIIIRKSYFNVYSFLVIIKVILVIFYPLDFRVNHTNIST